MKPGRRYGNKDSHRISVWNGILDHRTRMGSAIWEFLWCLDRITKEKDGIGFVLGGAPVKLKVIAKGIRGSDCETVRLHLQRLARKKYIRRRRTPYGYVIHVLNSQKFGDWKKPQNTVSLENEKPKITGTETVNHGDRNPKTGVSKEEKAGSIQKREQQHLAWRALAIAPCGSLPFQILVQNNFEKRNGASLPNFMAQCLDEWDLIRGREPRPREFCKRLSELREQEESCTAPPDAKVAFLPSIPFKKREFTMEDLCPSATN